MTPLHSLLVATDFSPQAGMATGRAARIARQHKARLELLHIIETRGLAQLQELFGQQSSQLVDRLETRFRTELENVATNIAEPLGVSAGLHLRSGKVLDEVCTVADGLDASLLVLGAHGTGSLRELLLGSTAERLLRRALRPLLLVRRPATTDYQRVLVGIDFSSGSRTALRFARALAPDIELSLFHAFEIPFESKLRFAEVEESVLDHHRARARQSANAELQQFAKDAGLDPMHDYHCLVPHGNAATRLLEAARHLKADLIVVCKHGISVSDELLLGSVTRQVLSEAECDVLVVR